MNAMWALAGALIGTFAPCQYFGYSGYEVIRKDPQSHYALHVFLNAEANGILRDYRFGNMDSARHGPFSREFAAMTAYYTSLNLRNEALYKSKELDSGRRSSEATADSRDYFRRLRAVSFELDTLVDLFAPDLATYGLYADTAHKWLQECRTACDGGRRKAH